ncbi:pumilio homolog 2 [Anopheles bellator]|uniref:pumilio homolog 2 n=1 Tax=Anopheles bellator TaxID=139047 RepID=UPI002647955E|nr:pumilio homolog 2 [Anopheles bellator]
MEDGGTDPENNNSSHCGMLGISMPCEGATGHDFATVRKELEYASAIAAHYGEKGDRVIGYKIENRRRSENCSRSNSPFLNPATDGLDGPTCGRSSGSSGSSSNHQHHLHHHLHNNNNNHIKPSNLLLRSAQDKMSPLSMSSGPGSSSATTSAAAAAAAVAAAAQVHLNGTMQDMLNLQKLQSLAQLTGASVLAPGLGLPSASPLLANSPLNLSLSSQSHSPVLGLGPAPAPLAPAAPQMPQLLLASGQILQGIQGAQLLIPTSQGIATQTILTIPVGQQVISGMSSEALLQSLNFNSSLSDSLSSQAAQAAAAAAAASGAALFATPRDASPVSGPGLLSTQQLLGTAGHSLQQHQQQQQQHSPKALHYANHHHHLHHVADVGKLRPGTSTSSSSTAVSGSSSPLHHHHHHSSGGPGTVSSSSARPGSCDLELIEQHVRSASGGPSDELPEHLDKPSAAAIGSGQSLQKRPHHHQHHHPPQHHGGGETSTSPPKLSPAGSARLDSTHSDDDDDEETSNQEFLEEHPNELTINQTNCNVVDGIDLDDIKEFAKAFKLRRLSLGLTQTQVGQALSVTEGPAYSQSAICSALAAQMYCAAQLSSQQQQMFEKLDITPKSAQKIKPVLERWMKEAEESHSSRYKTGQNHVPDFIGVEPSKKRKRRTSFTPQALELLNGHFERNTHPSGTEITGLAHQLGYEREVIRIWFCNKRQALKNTVRMMSKSFKMENT